MGHPPPQKKRGLALDWDSKMRGQSSSQSFETTRADSTSFTTVAWGIRVFSSWSGICCKLEGFREGEWRGRG